MIMIDCMDLDLAIQIEPPTALFDSSTTKEREYYEKQESSNRTSLMIVKYTIPKTIRGSISKKENAQRYLAQVVDCFAKNEKDEASTILGNLNSMRYKG